MGKICSKCEVYKPLSDYSRNAFTSDGLHNACDQCRSAIEHRRRKSQQAVRYAKCRDAASKGEFVDVQRCPHRQGEHVNQHGESVSDDVKKVARQQVIFLVRRGVMPKQREITCANCGDAAKVYHHLCYECNIVVPLCRHCHTYFHIPDTPVWAENQLWTRALTVEEGDGTVSLLTTSTVVL